MQNYSALKSKSAQVGETLTWIVATVTIFVMMLLFIYAVSAMAISKGTVFGIGSFVSDAGSSLAKQQILFGILNKDNGKIKQLLNNNPEGAKAEIISILANFGNQGLQCTFNPVVSNYITQIKNQDLGITCKSPL